MTTLTNYGLGDYYKQPKISGMSLIFSKLKGNPNQFFDILPTEWRNLIVPNWVHYKKTATIYVIKEAHEIICGGIVFSEKLNEMTPFEIEHLHLFSEGYNYLGYIWVVEHKRNQKLASKWLNCLKETHPNQKYWLTIEEEELNYFYKKNDFKLFAENKIDFNNNLKEWIFIYP